MFRNEREIRTDIETTRSRETERANYQSRIRQDSQELPIETCQRQLPFHCARITVVEFLKFGFETIFRIF